MGKIVLVMGLPGSGKTEYAKKMNGMKIHIDEIRKSMTGTYKPGQHDLIVYKNIEQTIEYYLSKEMNVIVDGALLSIKARNFYIKIAKRKGWKVDVHWLDPSMKIIKKRVEKRNQMVVEDRKISFDYIVKLASYLEIPTVDEGIEEIYYVK